MMIRRATAQLLLAACVLEVSSSGCKSTTTNIDSNNASSSASSGAMGSPSSASTAGTGSLGTITPASTPPEASPLSQDPSKMIQGKPVFEVRLDIENCPHDVYVNGGLVERNLDLGPAHIDYQVNHYLRSGRNDVEVLMPRMGKAPSECDVKLQFRYQDLSAPEVAVPITLLTLIHDAKTAPATDLTRGSSPSGTFDSKTGLPRDDGDVRVGPASVAAASPRVEVLSRSIDLTLRFQEWAFLRSDKMKIDWQMASDDEKTRPYEELLARYNELHALLKNHNVDAFLDACEERSREMDIAYYKPQGETRLGLEHDLLEAMKNPKFELADLRRAPGKRWGYVVGSKGTLATLTQSRQASPIFRYQLKDGTPFSIIFPALFRKDGNKYIVSR